MTRLGRIVVLLLLAWPLLAGPASAHELRAGFLGLTETDPATYDMIWKPPVLAGKRLDVAPVFPGECQAEKLSAQWTATGDVIENWRVSCEDVLAGRTIGFNGLEYTAADVLVRLQASEGEQSLRATSENPEVAFGEASNVVSVFKTYVVLGAQHIWEGVDHLLFVLCLVFLIGRRHRLLITITSFTLAHSLTLVATTLGWVRLSIAPVEAVIALSIMFSANEILSREAGQERLSERRPWLIAFVFGLLHGFGFASALSPIGLPADAIPAALLAFNIGVELGQLAYVAVLLMLLALMKRVNLYRFAERVSVYGAGIFATVWFIERLA